MIILGSPLWLMTYLAQILPTLNTSKYSFHFMVLRFNRKEIGYSHNCLVTMVQLGSSFRQIGIVALMGHSWMRMLIAFLLL